MTIPFLFTENRSSFQTKEHASQSTLHKHPLTPMLEEAAYFAILTPYDRTRLENIGNGHFLPISKTLPIYHLFLQCHQRGNRTSFCWQLTKRFIEDLTDIIVIEMHCNLTNRGIFGRTFKEHNHFSKTYAIKPFEVSFPLIPFLIILSSNRISGDLSLLFLVLKDSLPWFVKN